jgi:glycerophosphoryl diester phosphodiesterase
VHGVPTFEGIVVAHRGRARGDAENTISSLMRLRDTASAVEIDVRLTRDKVAVLMHDDMIDRTTQGSGSVGEKSYPELASIIGEGTPVPTLEDYLTACSVCALRLILIDVKSPDPDVLRTVARVVHASPVIESCVIMVRSEDQLSMARPLVGDLRLGSFGVTVDNVNSRIAAARRHGAEMLLVQHGDHAYLNNRPVVAAVHRAGLTAGASTINAPEALAAAQVDGCDLVVTDRSELVLPAP